MSSQSLSALIWSTADLLRGDYKQSDYGKVILPFTLLRRLECVLEPTRQAVLDDEVLTKSGVIRSLYDPTAGTGGFLSSVQSTFTSLVDYLWARVKP